MRTCRPAAWFRLAGSSGACSRVTSRVWEVRSSLIIHTKHPSGHGLRGRRGERGSITETQDIPCGLRPQSLPATEHGPQSLHPLELTQVCPFHISKPKEAEGSVVTTCSWDTSFPARGPVFAPPEKPWREILSGLCLGSPGWSPRHPQPVTAPALWRLSKLPKELVAP